MLYRFILSLLGVITATVMVAGVLTYNEMSRHAENRAEKDLSDALRILHQRYESSIRQMNMVADINEQSMLARARCVSEILSLNPEIADDVDALQHLCNDVCADSIIVCDEKGTVRASAPEFRRGETLGSEYGKLVECAEGKTHERTMLVRSKDDSCRSTRHAAVRTYDTKGVVILSFYLEHESRARERSSVANLVNSADLGENGYLLAFDAGEAFAPDTLPASEAELRALKLNTLHTLTFNDEDYFVYVSKKNNLRLIAVVPTEDYYTVRTQGLWLQVYTCLTLVLATLVTLIVLVHRFVLRNIDELNGAMTRIGDGNFDEKVRITSSPEFRRLAVNVNNMIDSLRRLDDENAETNERELRLARSIKASVMPKPEQAFAHRKDFSLVAALIQAETVGGDFYDCTLLDDDHLFFVLGSINEQGVPAALYMMRGLSIIRNYTSTLTDAKSMVESINLHICQGDRANMQVSMFVAVMEVSTGTVCCVNAGQHIPLLQRLDSEYQDLPMPVSPLVGESPDSVFYQYSFRMQPGERLFACTNALTCMQNAERETYGEQRLHEALRENAPTLRDVPHLVRTSVRRFVQKASRTKDYTMVALEIPGLLRSGGSITVPAGEAPKAVDMIQEALERVFASPNDISDLAHNVSTIMAAIPGNPDVRVVLECTERHARVTLTYTGSEHNVLHGLAHLGSVSSSSYNFAENINDIVLHKDLE